LVPCSQDSTTGRPPARRAARRPGLFGAAAAT
jgi:hypothetical protein